MDIRWLNVVIDVPAGAFDAALDFWPAVTATTLGEVHPPYPEFVHLLPRSGAMHLELQRIEGPGPGAHLDLLVPDIEAAVEEAVELGAHVVARPGHAVLQTPGGVTFCVVPWIDEAERAPIIDPQLPHAADQICLDVPATHFDTDIAFWSALTGWDLNPRQLDEFQSFAQPPELPVRLLLQRLGSDDPGPARSHLDFSCGPNVDAVVERHQAQGSTFIERGHQWAVLRAPDGSTYCLTARRPPD